MTLFVARGSIRLETVHRLITNNLSKLFICRHRRMCFLNILKKKTQLKNQQYIFFYSPEDVLLRRFFTSCGYSLERAKRTIDFFFTIRSTAPELFCKRDPWSPEIRRVFEIT